jgi:ABC-type antimicrobial peptide transport system permease subunit
VLSQIVAQREHEIGIRMALGAGTGTVLRMLLRQAVEYVAVGAAVGLLAYLALARFLSSLLYQVTPTDPLTITVVTLLLMGVALVASLLPALRASRVDPIVALRNR